MKPFFFRFLAVFALAALGAGAWAQERTSADELIQAGLAGLRQIDEDRSGEVWEVAPAFVKAKLPKAEFTSNMRRTRQTVGSVARRDWASVVRIRYLDDSGGVPPGQYANVDYATHLSDGKTVFEMVSFRLEPEGWRVTGYIPRTKQ